MNRKKICKLLSSVVSGIYIINTSSVFAMENNVDISNKNNNNISTENLIESDRVDNLFNDEHKEVEQQEENIINKEDNSSKEDENKSTNIEDDTVINDIAINLDLNQSSKEVENTVIQNNENNNDAEDSIIENNQSEKSVDEENINTQNSNIVNFEDTNLLNAVNKALSKGDINSPVTIDEMATLNSSLNISNLGITSLSGLEYAVNLKSLSSTNNQITDLSPLSNLTSLQNIDLGGNTKLSGEAVSSLSNLNNIVSLIIPIDAPEYILNIGSNGLFPNIQMLTIKGSNIGTLNIENAGSISYVDASSCNIDNFISKDSNINSFSLQNSKINTISVANCSRLSSFNLYSSEINNLEVDACNTLSGITFTNSDPKNITLKNLPALGSVNLTGITASSLIFDNITSRNNVSVTNSIVENLMFTDSNVSYLELNGSTIENISLDNLTYLSTIIWQNLTCPKITINNCNNFTSVMINGAKLEGLDLSEQQNLYSLVAMGAELNFLTLNNSPKLSSMSFSDAKIKNLNISNLDAIKMLTLMNGKFEDLTISNMSQLMDLNIKGIIANNVNIIGCTNLTQIPAGTKNISNLSLSNLDLLQELDLSNSNLDTLSINDCLALNKLNAGNNNLKNVDTIIAPNLLDLNLSQNKLESVSDMLNYSSLEKLNIDNNSIKNISELKNILNLDIANISSLNQDITLESISVKPGEVHITYPEIIDYDGNKVPLKQTSFNTKNVTDKIFLGEFSEGNYSKNIEFESTNSNYSAIAKQDLSVDGTAPTIKLTQDIDYYTNGSVLLNINAADNESGLNYIKLPNGDVIYSEKGEFKVTKNGTYEFEAVDFAGNSAINSITITNIDTTSPTIKTSVLYNTNSTEAIVSVEAQDDESGILNMTLPDGKIVESNKTSFIVRENGIYEVRIRDVAGNLKIEKITVTNIADKNTPNEKPEYNIKEEMPDTSGVSPIINIISIISLIAGVLSLRKKR